MTGDIYSSEGLISGGFTDSKISVLWIVENFNSIEKFHSCTYLLFKERVINFSYIAMQMPLFRRVSINPMQSNKDSDFRGNGLSEKSENTIDCGFSQLYSLAFFFYRKKHYMYLSNIFITNMIINRSNISIISTYTLRHTCFSLSELFSISSSISKVIYLIKKTYLKHNKHAKIEVNFNACAEFLEYLQKSCLYRRQSFLFILENFA